MSMKHRIILLLSLILCVFCDLQLVSARRDKSELHPGDKNFDKYLTGKVNKELRQEYFREKRRKINKAVYGGTARTLAKQDKVQPDLTYKLPHWPFYSLFFEQHDLFQIALSGDYASRAYSNTGHSQDLSRLVFGQKSILIKDISLVSKLAASDKFDKVGSTEYPAAFKKLAGQPLVFDASVGRLSASFNFSSHARNGDIAYGFSVPIVARHNRLKLTSELTPAIKADLTAKKQASEISKAPFTNINLESIFQEILNAKDIRYDRNCTKVGVGDLAAFVRVNINSSKAERLLFGLNFLFPVGKERNMYTLWDPELGNGGFVELTPFVSVLWDVYRFLNPHIHASFTYNFTSRLNRRVPKSVKYATNRKEELPRDLIAFGDLVKLKDGSNSTGSFNELNATVRRFADTVQRTKIRKGHEFYFQVGNMFERVIFKRGFLDIFYDFRYKDRDHLGARRVDDVYDPSILIKDTRETEHRLGLDFSYQFNNYYRLALGARYSFAGENIPQTFAAHLDLNIEF